MSDKDDEACDECGADLSACRHDSLVCDHHESSCSLFPTDEEAS